MPFNVTQTTLSGVLILEPVVYSDKRGFFLESYNERDFLSATGVDLRFVQDNHSRSNRGVLRGLHYQIKQPQGELVRVTQGEIFDVCVNLQQNHPQFGCWTGVHLSAQNKRQLWIPPGFAHGFLVLSDDTDVIYKTTDYYSQHDEHCIRWDDARLGINWPLESLAKAELTLAPKDIAGSCFSNAEVFS